MRYWPALIALVTTLPAPASAGVLLDVDFEQMSPGSPVAVGGPIVGRAGGDLSGAITTRIERHDDSNWLAIGDNDEYAAGAVRFEGGQGRGYLNGEVAFSADLYFDPISEGSTFFVYVREAGSSASTFLSLTFSDTGNISLSDQNTPHKAIATYGDRTGRPLPLDLVFDMEALTYDVWLDGELVVEAERHGIEEVGVGSILFGTAHDADYEGVLYVDNVMMTHERADRLLW